MFKTYIYNKIVSKSYWNFEVKNMLATLISNLKIIY